MRSATNLAALLMAGALAGCGGSGPSFKSTDITGADYGKDFALTDHTGKARTLGDFRGKVVVMFFGYTHCPQICPTTLADLAQVMRMLDKDADRVQVLFVTLDPERDSRELLAQYPPAFYPTFKGLSGDSMATAQAAQAFGVIYQKQPNKNGGYDLDHSAGTYLIAPGGKPVLLAPYGQRAELLVQDIKLLLAFK